MKKAPVILRRCSQIFFLAISVYILWPKTPPHKGILSKLILFKIDPLIVIATSISARTVMFGALVSGVMLFLTVILGRFFCGWMCPMGASIDLVGSLRKSNLLKKDSVNKKIRKAKFILLGIAVAFAIFSQDIAWIPDPMVIVSRAALSKIIFAVFLIICSSSLIASRLWCRAICPLGALYALFAKFAFLERTVSKCKECKTCKSECRTAAIKDDLGYVKSECVLCMDCLYDCPQNVTRFKFRPLNIK